MIKISSATAGYLSRVQKNKSNSKNKPNQNLKQPIEPVKPKPVSKINYKTAILYIGIGAAVLALLYKSNPFAKLQAGEIVKNAEKLKDESVNVLNNSEKEFNTVKNILEESKINGFQDVSDESGNIIRSFIKGDNLNLMHEFNGDKITREVEFDPKNLHFEEILKDVEYLEDNSKNAGNSFLFSPEGNLESFMEKYFTTIKGSEKSKNMFMFEKGKLVLHTDTCITSLKEGADMRKCTWFDTNGKIISYAKRNVRTYDGYEYIKSAFQFDESGKLTNYKR